MPAQSKPQTPLPFEQAFRAVWINGHWAVVKMCNINNENLIGYINFIHSIQCNLIMQTCLCVHVYIFVCQPVPRAAPPVHPVDSQVEQP